VGSSFLLHHIRHMIGGAIAVASGAMSCDLLRAALSLPARVSTPRAPPHSLLLRDCDFFGFPTAVGANLGAAECAARCCLAGAGAAAE
jgi:tRNA pseudouridine38-40 synthase